MWSTWPTPSLLTLSPLLFHIFSLFPCGIFMNYPCICGCTYLLIYLQYLFLFGKYRKRCSFSPWPFLCHPSPFSHSFFQLFLIPFSAWQSVSSPEFRNVSLSLTHPVQILSGHLDWGQMPRPVAEPIDFEENQGQRWLRSTTEKAIIAGTVNPYLTTSLNVAHIFIKVIKKVLQWAIIRLCDNYTFP